VIAFFFGVLVQFLTRLLFTFDYQKRLKRYGGIWGGLALSVITYFILIKGAKGTPLAPMEGKGGERQGDTAQSNSRREREIDIIQEQKKGRRKRKKAKIR